MSLVCCYTTSDCAWTAGTTCRVHFTLVCDIFKGKCQTIRPIETAEEAFADVVCKECFVERNAVFYFQTNGLLHYESRAFLHP